MRLMKLYWRPWDQGQAIANALTATVELWEARAAREEVELYLRRVNASAVPDVRGLRDEVERHSRRPRVSVKT